MYTRRTGLARQGWKVARWSTNWPRAAGVFTTTLSTPGVFLPALTCVTLRTDMRMLEWLRSMSFWSERTLRRSFACVARKMRCLRLRTIRSASRQSMASQTVRSVPRVRLPGRSLASNLSRGWQPSHRTLGDSPDPRQRPFGSGQRPYPPGYGFPVPFGGRHSLLGSSCARCGIGPSFRRSSGLLAGGQTATGLPRSAPDEMRRGRVPPLLRGLGVPGARRWHALTRRRSRSGSWPIIAASAIDCGDLRYAASTKVHLRSPFPSFPRPVRPDGSGLPWASPVCFRTLRYLALARVGNRHGHISGSWRLATTTHPERLRVARLYE